MSSSNGTYGSNGNGRIDWSASYITPEWVEKSGVYHVDHVAGAELLGRNPDRNAQKCDGIAIPYFPPGSTRPCLFRLRRDFPDYKVLPDGSRKEEGKYLGASGWGTASAYFPPETSPEWLSDSSIPAIIVEGEKKAIALRRYYFERDESVLVIGLPGVWNFRARANIREDGFFIGTESYVIQDLTKINWQNRRTKILFDSNALTNPSVNAARWELGRQLVGRGADVRIVDLEPSPGVNGADDFLGKYGPKAFGEYLATHTGQPVWMEVEDARKAVAELPQWIDGDTSKVGSIQMINALAVVQDQSPNDWLQAQTVLRGAGALLYIKEQIKLTKAAGPKFKIVKPSDGPKNAPLPIIDFGFTTDLPPLTRAAWAALKAINTGPHLFMRSGIMVRFEKDEAGRAILTELTTDRMRFELARAANWQKKGEDDMPPLDVVRDVLAMPEPPLPTLRKIVNVPIFSHDGRLIDKPGFDSDSGIYYLPASDFEAIPLPEVITQAELDEANRLIKEELLVDFPFASNADRDNAVALAALPAAREMIDGSTPNHSVEASIRSAGKGKLARGAAGIFVGNDLASTPPLETEKEWKDMITSELLSGSSAVLIDNIERPLRSAALATAWTEPFWKDRLFHRQVMARVPINCVWITTANNMVMHEDLMTRSIRIRLEPETSKPESRTGFKHPNFDQWCRENRANLVWAIHILVQWWIQEGRPAATVVQSSRHADWCRVMGGILHAAGYKDFLTNQQEFQRTAAQGVDAAASFCSLWWEWANRKSVIADGDSVERRLSRAFTSELLDLARNIDGFPLTDNKDGQSRAMGLWLNGVRGRRIESEEDVLDRRVRRVYRIQKHATQIRGKQPWKMDLLDEVDLGEALNEG